MHITSLISNIWKKDKHIHYFKLKDFAIDNRIILNLTWVPKSMDFFLNIE